MLYRILWSSVIHQQESVSVYPCLLPSRPPSHLPPHSPLQPVPVWVPWVMQQIPMGYLLYTLYCKFLCYSIIHLLFSLLPFYYVHFSITALNINSSVPSVQIPYICISIWYLYFSFWLTSLCIMSSSFPTSLEQIEMCSFLWLSRIPLDKHTTASLSIHLLMDI